MSVLKLGLSLAVVLLIVGVFAQVLSGAVNSFTQQFDAQTSQVR